MHDTPAAALREAEIVVCMLESGPVIEEVLFRQGAAEAMRPGTLFIDMASIQPREARDHAARLAARQVQQLDAPVSGGTGGAENGTLAIMVGGKAADFERAAPVFQVLGRATHVGPAGAGELAKLANQMIVGITIGAVAEALLLCQKGGADMAKVREAIGGGFAESRILQVHGQRMVERDFAPRAKIAIQLKDMRNALATAEEIGFEAPVTALFEQLYAQAGEHGLADLDHAGPVRRTGFAQRPALIRVPPRGNGCAALLQCNSLWGGSSAGRASRSQCEGREFDPPPLHHNVPEKGLVPTRPFFFAPARRGSLRVTVGATAARACIRTRVRARCSENPAIGRKPIPGARHDPQSQPLPVRRRARHRRQDHRADRDASTAWIADLAGNSRPWLQPGSQAVLRGIEAMRKIQEETAREVIASTSRSPRSCAATCRRPKCCRRRASCCARTWSRPRRSGSRWRPRRWK